MSKSKNITNHHIFMRAGAITVSLYLLFALLVQPETKPTYRPNTPPLKISYIQRTNINLEKRYDLWSPVLFSLPDEQGFSATFLKSHNFETESVRIHADRFTQFLDTPRIITEPATRRLLTDAAPSLKISMEKTTSIFSSTHVNLQTGIHLKVANGLATRLISQPDTDNTVDLPSGSWQHTASITVNTHGQVVHAFIEPNIGQPANTVSPSVLNTLYRLQFKSAANETQGQITIYSLAEDPAE